MLLFKICAVSLLAIAAAAEKKIELTDIEADNLKSEQEKEQDKIDSTPQNTGGNLSALDFFKSGLLRYFETPQPQQPRYVQQYAVTEPPEKPPTKPTYQISPGPNQAMVGYLSNTPMQIYLVPQFYNEQTERAQANTGVQYASNALSRVSAYTSPEATQQHTNYIEVPSYVTPTGQAFMPQYQQPQYQQPQYQQQVSYVTYTPQPAVTSTNPQMAMVTAPGAAQTVLYQMPVPYQYPTAVMAPPVFPKSYYVQSQINENTLEEPQESGIESPKEYETQSESPYSKTPEYPRYYTSRAPVREEHRPSSIQELPPPNPLLLRHPPPHLAHLPKALPYYRPLNKPVYATGAGVAANAIQRPGDAYGAPFRRRPMSLLESYIPSSVQVEYLKRGYGKDPLQVYDALSSNRHLSPRHFERGFLPNQMYHTAAGGVTFGQYKRTTKPEKLTQK